MAQSLNTIIGTKFKQRKLSISFVYFKDKHQNLTEWRKVRNVVITTKNIS